MSDSKCPDCQPGVSICARCWLAQNPSVNPPRNGLIDTVGGERNYSFKKGQRTTGDIQNSRRVPQPY